MDEHEGKLLELIKSFDYRVVAREIGEYSAELGIYEVYYSELGTIVACSLDPITLTIEAPLPVDEDLAEQVMGAELERVYSACSKTPLMYKDIPHKIVSFSEDDPLYEGNFEEEDII